jgi:hypothetical protein
VLRRLLAGGYALAAISQDETAGMTLYRIDPTRRADE